jgi:hypothetical protein
LLLCNLQHLLVAHFDDWWATERSPEMSDCLSFGCSG